MALLCAASCAKPEVEPEKPVTKATGPEWKLTQTTQSGSGIIYDVQISNGYLYIFSNANRPVRVKWQNLYYVVKPENQFNYWTEAAPNGQPIQPYSATITISAQTSNFGDAAPNFDTQIQINDPSLPWYKMDGSDKIVADPKSNYASIGTIPWSQPKPQKGWSASSFVTQYETRMYDITRVNGDYSNM